MARSTDEDGSLAELLVGGGVDGGSGVFDEVEAGRAGGSEVVVGRGAGDSSLAGAALPRQAGSELDAEGFEETILMGIVVEADPRVVVSSFITSCITNKSGSAVISLPTSISLPLT